MSRDTTPAPTAYETAAHDALVDTLRDTHALEKQQIQVLEAHLDLYQDSPDLHTRVTEHIVATRDQARRLEAGLEACGGSASMVKDTLMSVMGFGQSSVQGFGNQVELKALLADIMQEHLEIATYRVLLVLADEAGKPDLRPRLEDTLHEEEMMAAWFDDNLETVTRRFVELQVAGERQEAAKKARVKQAETDKSPTSDSEMSGTLWQQLESANQPGVHPGSAKGTGREEVDTPPASPRPDTKQPATAQDTGSETASRPAKPADRT